MAWFILKQIAITDTDLDVLKRRNDTVKVSASTELTVALSRPDAARLSNEHTLPGFCSVGLFLTRFHCSLPNLTVDSSSLYFVTTKFLFY